MINIVHSSLVGFRSVLPIRQTCPSNKYPLKPLYTFIYIVKLGFAGPNIFPMKLIYSHRTGFKRTIRTSLNPLQQFYYMKMGCIDVFHFVWCANVFQDINKRNYLSVLTKLLYEKKLFHNSIIIETLNDTYSIKKVENKIPKEIYNITT